MTTFKKQFGNKINPEVSLPERLVIAVVSFAVAFSLIVSPLTTIAAESTFTTSLTTTGVSTAPPPIPTGLTATSVSDTQIDLSWNASVPTYYTVAGYRVFRDGVFLATTTALTYSDTGLTPETTYSYTVEAFDTAIQLSGQSGPVTATTEATPITPVTTPAVTPGGGGGGGGGSGRTFYISNIQVLAGSNLANLTFDTNLPAQTKVEWGLSKDFEIGSLQNIFYGVNHSQMINGLNPDQKYYVRITATSAYGIQVSSETSFRTLPKVIERGPLPNPSDFLASPVEKNINLTWTNPNDDRFRNVRIIRSEGFYPIDQFDGEPIYEGRAESFVDAKVKPGVIYYYAIFARSYDGEFSSGALAQAKILLPGEEVATSTDPFAGIVDSNIVDPMIKSLSLSDFEFIQEGRQLVNISNTVAINGGKDLIIRLKYEKVPEILKTIAFSLQDPDDASKNFPFLLRVNANKTYYEATLGAFGKSGRYSMQVVVLDYENKGLVRLNGTLAALVFRAFPFDFAKNFDFLGLGLLLIFILILLLVVRIIKRWLNKQAEAEDRRKELNYSTESKPINIYKISLFVLAILMTGLFIEIGPRSVFALTTSFNPQINYQGKLVNASNVTVTDGTYNIRFKLYQTLTGGSPIWTETWCNTSDCAGTGSGTDDRIRITNGLFSTMLGSTTAFANNFDFNQPLYLSVDIGGSGDTAVWDGEMSPRKIIGAVPVAFLAGTSTVAVSANSLQGLTSSQFLRSDTQNATSSATTFLNMLQNGAGKIAEFVSNAASSVLSILSTGNVGVGSTTPYAKLSVAGDSNGTSPVLSISTSTAVSTSTAFLIDQNGKVGIGTTSPYAQLSVAGLASASYFNADSSVATSTFAGGLNVAKLAIGSLTGPLQAVGGYVTSTSTLSIGYGGTGLSTAPSYGNILVGNALGGYTLSATSTLNFTIPLASTTGILAVVNGGTGQSSFGQGWLAINDSGAFLSSTSPTVNYITATSSTATSTFAGGLIVQTSKFVVQSGSGYIGLGTTTPGTLLSLGNTGNDTINISATATSTFGSGLDLRTGCFAVNGTCLTSGSGSGTVNSGTLGYATYYAADGTTVSATSSIFFATNRNIGIGTTSPSAKLSIGSFGGTQPQFIISSSTGASATTTSLIVDRYGNVGVGTTTVPEKLTVEGNVAPSMSNQFALGSFNLASKNAVNANITINGIADSNYMGQSVANAGDVNGDGINDVIVGAHQAAGGGAQRGSAYVFFGSTTALTSYVPANANITISGIANADLLGYSVASAGDVNGDGYGDIIVGAYSAVGGGTDRGQAYIFYGGPALTGSLTASSANVTITGIADSDGLGYSVASAGDINGDGYCDVVIGANLANAAGTDRGQAYVFYGKPDLAGSYLASAASIIISGIADSDTLGNSVASAGDVNGDGYSDLLIGATNAAGGGTTKGQAYLFYGKTNLSSTYIASAADVIITGAANSEYAGKSVASAGDVNGDGYGDIIVGAHRAHAGGTELGWALVFYGKSNLQSTYTTAQANVTIAGIGSSDWLGWSVASAGDVNGDGYGDLIVGAYRVNNGGTDRGSAYIFYGSQTMSGTKSASTADVTYAGIADNDDLGWSVASAGDVNADGYADVIVGAYTAAGGGTARGSAYIFTPSGNRFKSIYAQSGSFTKGIQLGGGAATLTGYALSTLNPFSLSTANWSIAKGGTAALQDAVINSFLSVGTTATSSSVVNINGFGYNDLLNVSSSTYSQLVLKANGNLGLGTSTPWADFSIAGASLGTNPLFVISSSTASATSTAFLIDSNGKVGIGTTTPGSALSIGNSSSYINLNPSATSTFSSGINLATGCFAVNGTCLTSGSGSGTVNSGTLGYASYYAADGTTVSATSSLFFGSNQNIGIGTTSPYSILSISNTASTPANIPLFTIASTTGGNSTSTLFMVDATGAVGIGNVPVSPYKLYTNGAGYFASSLTAPQLVINNSSFGITTSASGVPLKFGLSNTFNAAIISTSGNFGIATSSPWAVLSIAASSTNPGNIPLFAISTSTASATSTAFIIDSNGKVGVGTSSPYAQLSVAGLAAAASFNADSTTATSTFAGGLNVSKLAIGSLTGPLQAVNGYVTSTSTLSISYGGTGLSTAPSYGQILLGNASNSYTLSATSSLGFLASTTIGSLTTNYLPKWTGSIFGNSLIYDSGTNVGIATSSPYARFSLHAGATDTYNATLFVVASSTSAYATSTLFNVLANGNVGLGTTTPGTLLSLGNTGNDTINISATATSTFGSGLNLRTGCFAINGTCLGGGTGSGTVNSGTLGYASYYAADGTAVSATSSLFFGSNQNIGIGTTSPYSILSISNSATTPINTPLFTIASTTGGNSTSTLLSMLPSGDLMVYNKLRIATTSTQSNNNQLIVNGSVHIDDFNTDAVVHLGTNSAGAGNGANIAAILYGSPTYDNWVSDGQFGGLAISAYNGIYFSGSGWAQQFSIQQNGRIGIGTTTPGTLLSLGNTGNNTINISATATSTFGSGLNLRTGCFAVNGTCLTSGSGSGTVNSGTLGYVAYYAADGTAVSATSSLYFATNQNIGIGTTSPSAKLSIGSYGGTQPQFIISSSTGASATTTSLIVDRYGNVGVGTTTVPEKLTVEGNVAPSMSNQFALGSFNLTSKVASAANITINGIADSNALGQSVASAGDVNGDGINDVIVGANSAAGGGTGRGQAYIFFGSTTALTSYNPSSAEVTISGIADYDNLGFSVASAGDVNGDGYSDVIIGALSATAGGVNRGQAYIFFGGPSFRGSYIASSANVTISGVTNGDNLAVVSSAGDMNGDGYGDVIVGATGAEAGGTNRGQAYIFYGKQSLTGTYLASAANVIISGTTNSNALGNSLASAGDVNGDGYGDIIIGAASAAGGGTSRGQAYVFYGKTNLASTYVASAASIVFSGISDGGFLGQGVASAGDVNGDGYSDVIMGAYNAAGGGSLRGEVYIYYGKSNLLSSYAVSTADVIISGAVNSDQIGNSVASAGDLNSDGYSDFIIGGYYAPGGGTNRGQAYVFYGKQNLASTYITTAADIIYSGIANSDFFGTSVASAGDINADGYPDIIVGATSADAGGSNRGSAYIFTPSGNRFKSIYAQSGSFTKGIQLGGGAATLTGYALSTLNPFSLSTANWSIAKGGTAALQDAVINSFLSVGTTATSSSVVNINGFGYNDLLNVSSSTYSQLVLKANGNLGLGTSTPWGDFSVAGSSLGTNPLFVISSSTASATSTAFLIDSNGKVGIGTTTPGSALSIGNSSSYINLNPSATSTFSSGINLATGCFAVNGTCLTSGSGSGTVNSGTLGYASYYAADGTAVSATSSLFFGSNQNIGIGTTSPYAKLSVHAGATDAYNATLFSIASSTTAYATSTLFTVLANGNVGIGTSSPAAALGLALGTTAAGGISFGGDTTLYRSAAGNLNTDGTMIANIFFSNQVVSANMYGGIFASGNLTLDSTSDATKGNIIMSSSGQTKVGIGSSSPYSLLSISNTVSTPVNTPLFTIASTTGGNSTTTLLTVLANGKVGVGTTSPYSQLGVGGALAATYFNADNALATSTLAGGLILKSLNGILTGVNGNVYASTTLAIAYGGTGTSTAPTYGKLLMGDGTGAYDLVATSSLGILASSAIGLGSVGQIPYYSNAAQAVTATSSIFLATNSFFGIGTTTPTSALSVFNASAPQFQLAYNKDNYLTTAISATGGVTMAVNGSAGGFTLTNPQPTVVGSGTGTNAPFGFSATGGIGGNSDDTGSGIGGVGGGLQLIAGAGGTATLSTGVETAGAGGAVTLNSGAGGAASAAASVGILRVAGAGGLLSFAAGNGGDATNGGVASSNTAGSGGIITLKAGTGGNASGASANNGGAGGSMYLSGGAGGTGSTANGSAGDLYLGYDSTSAIGNVYFGNRLVSYIGSSGNLGVGTTSPFAKLSIHANSNDSYLSTLFNISSSTANATTSLFSVLANGNITMGSTTATTTILGGLDVGGGGLTYDYYSGVTSVNAVQLGGAMSFDTNAGVVQWVDLPTDSGASNNTVQSYTAALNGSSTLTIYGISDGNGNLQGDGPRVSIGSSTAPSSKLTVFGGGYSTGGLFELVNAASTTLLKVLDNGNVGIGTTSAGTLLSLGNTGANTINISATATSTFGSGIDLRTGCFSINGTCVGGGTGSGSGTVNSGTLGYFPYYAADGTTLTATSSLYLATTQNIGIGSSSPLARLSVSSYGGTQPQFIISSSTGASATTTSFIVDRFGNVGIGTSSPVWSLDLAGNIGLLNTSSATTGVIYKGANSFIHNFQHPTGNGNVPIGQNTFIGVNAGNLTTGSTATQTYQASYLTAVGYGALSANTTGYENTAIGRNALLANSTGYYNMAVGSSALQANNIGYKNAAIGYSALTANTQGSENTAIGQFSLGSNNTGNRSSAVGSNSLSYQTSGSNNVAIGFYAGAGDVIRINQDQRSISDRAMTFIGFQSSRGGLIGSTTAMATSTAIGANSRVDCSNCMALGGVGQDYVNVGIGTTSPFAKLSISANYYDPNVNTLFNISSSTAAGATTTLFTVLANGNVGIGKNNPSYTLDVNGTIKATIFATDPTYTYLQGSGLTAYYVRNINSDVNNGILTLSGEPGPTGSTADVVSITSTSYHNLVNTSGTRSFLSVNSFYNQSSGSASNNDLSVLRNETAIGSGTQYLLKTDVGGSLNSYATSTKFSVDRTGLGYFAGNLGLGTTTPGTMLSLGNTGNDTININPSATSTFGSGIDLRTGCFSINGTCVGGGTGSGSGTVNSGTLGYFPYYAADGTTLTATSSLFLATNQNIGIGTTSPFARLSIFAGATSAYNATLFAIGSSTAAYATSTLFSVFADGDVSMSATTSTTTIYGGLDVGSGGLTYDSNSGVTTAAAFQTGNLSFDLNAGAVSWTDLTIDSSAPANTPQSYTANLNSSPMLTVHGLADGAGNITNSGVGIGTTTPWGSFAISPFANAYPAFTIATSTGSFAGTYFMVDGKGNVGVGTSSPWARLSVSATSSNAIPLFVVASTTGTATSTAFMIDSNGKVGIGTTTPGTMLSLGNTGNDTININPSATSTFGSGIDLRTGCFSINGTCVGGGTGSGSGTVNSGTLGYFPYYAADGTTLTATSSLFLATNQNIGIGTTSPFARLSIFAGATSAYNATLFAIGSSTAAYATSTLFSVFADGDVSMSATTSTTTIYGGLDVGSGAINYDWSSGLTSVSGLQLSGAMNFDTDAGMVSWVDMPQSSALVRTVQGYSASLGGLPVLTIYGLADGSGGISATTTTVAIGTSTPYTAGLTVWGNDTLSGTRVLDVINNASTSILTAYNDGAIKIGGTTSTTTINGYLDVIGTGTNSTSTISSNLWVKGTLRSNLSYVGDLVFANNFAFTESQPIDATTTQALQLKNQDNQQIMSIDDAGNLNITGDICANNVTCVNKSIDKLSGEMTALASSTALLASSTADLQAGILSLAPGNTQVGTALSSTQTLADAIVALDLKVDALIASSTMDANTLFASTSAALASSTEFIASIASSTSASLLANSAFIDAVASSTISTIISSSTNSSFVATIAVAVKNALASAGDWVMERLTAKIAFVTRVEAETIAISKGMEIVDQVSGSVYCVTIKNGDWSKVQGKCADVAPVAPVADVSLPVAPVAPITDVSLPVTTSTTTDQTTPTPAPVIPAPVETVPAPVASSTPVETVPAPVTPVTPTPAETAPAPATPVASETSAPVPVTPSAPVEASAPITPEPAPVTPIAPVEVVPVTPAP